VRARAVPGVARFTPYVALIVAIGFRALMPAAPFDDAYITFRYARNLSEGLGFVYNSGQPVLGTTTPLFTALLAAAALGWGSAAIPDAANLISLASDAAAVLLLYHLARRAFGSGLVALLLATAYALNPFRASVAAGGMEASLFTLLLLLSFERLVLARSLVGGGIAAALAILVRPDALLFLAPYFASLWLGDRRFAVRSLLLIGVLLSPWLIGSTLYFGSPLPNSIIAKGHAYTFQAGFASCFVVAFFGTGVVQPCWELPMPAVLPAALGIAAVVIGLIHAVRRMPQFAGLVASGPVYLIVLAGLNAPMFFPWYFYPALPSLLFGIVSAVWFLPSLSRKMRSLAAGLALLATVVGPAYHLAVTQPWPMSREREAVFRELCSAFDRQIPSKAVVLAPDIGVIGWCLEKAEIVDPIGLVSPAAIAFLEGDPDLRVISPALVAASEPDYIVTVDQYLLPLLVERDRFAREFELVWDREFSVSGDIQHLLVFQRIAPPPR
jgi:hypothetical protein